MINRSQIVTALFAATVACALNAQTPPNPNTYINTVLVTNVKTASAPNAVVDPNLGDPWGIATSAASPFWVSNHLTGTSTLYNGSGVITPTVVKIPSGGGSAAAGTPTGQVNNSTTTAFLLANGKSASFIFDTEDGTISGWNGGAASEVKVDNSGTKAVYKGLAIGNSSGGATLYAANFRSGKIDVFDSHFAQTATSGLFADPAIPAGFAPFNIWNLGGTLYVTYAKQDGVGFNDVAGSGNGYVSTFDLNGNLKSHLIASATLNSPWGVALAPANWGAFGGAVLVGNFGDGRINAFDPKAGTWLGTLQDATGMPITIPGLWALIVGNGGRGGDVNTIYYAGGTPHGSQIIRGVLGSLAPPAAVSSVVNAASILAGPIAPGEIVVVNGQTVGPSPLVAAAIPPVTGPLASTLGGTKVTVNGIAAPIVFTTGNQTSVQIPYAIAGSTTANIVVTTAAQTTAAFTVPVAPTAPGVFTLDFTGKGQVVALNADGTVNSPKNAADRGGNVLIFVTGEGATNPAGVDGMVQVDTMRMAVAPVTVTFNGLPAVVNFAGGTPKDVAGVLEVQVVVPKGITPGAADLAVSVGGVPAQTGLIIYVK